MDAKVFREWENLDGIEEPSHIGREGRRARHISAHSLPFNTTLISAHLTGEKTEAQSDEPTRLGFHSYDVVG